MRALARATIAGLLMAWIGTASAASSPGAWKTFIRAREFTALVADDAQVWGATAEAGLVRWDRATTALEIVRREPGTIASNRLTALARDRSGQLWVATEGSGVSRRSADGRRWDVVNLLDGLPTDSVRVLEAIGDTVWIGTTQGFSLWNGRQVSGSLPDGITVSFDTTFSSTSVTGIAQLGDTVWVATRRGVGLARLSQRLSDWRPVNDGLAFTDVQSLASDGKALFVQIGADVYRWRSELSTWAPEPGAGLVHRLTDAGGTVLVTGESGAFRWFQTAVDSGWAALPDAPQAAPGSGADPEITLAPGGQAFAALGETLLVASSTPGPWIRYPLPDGPPGNDLLQVVLEGPRIYITSNDAGIARYDGATWRHWPTDFCVGPACDTTFYHAMFVLGFFADRSGRKWAGCWSQALDSFRDDVSPSRFTHEVTVVDEISQRRSWFVCATQDTSGAIWFGMDTPFKGDVEPIGLEVYDSSGAYRRNFNSTNSTLSANLVHGLTFANGRVWIGFDTGGLDFVTMPGDSGDFVHITATNGLAVRGVASFGDSIWLVTNTELWRFGSSAIASSPVVKIIKLRGGLPLLGVKPLAIGRDGSAWVGTNTGLRVFHPGVAIDSFNTTNSPIPADEVRAIAVEPGSGAIWITTNGGLARFDPSYLPPPTPPRAVLHARVYPNPAWLTGIGIQLHIDGDAEKYSGAVYDITGRRIRRFHGAVNGGLVWDGRDEDGRLVLPGIYFLRAEAQGASAVARVVLLH